MPELTPFEARLVRLLEEESLGGVRPIDRYAIARAVASHGHRRAPGGAFGVRRWLMPVVLGLVFVALPFGVFIVGSRLLEARPDPETIEQPVVVAASPSPSATVTPAPVAEPFVEPTRQPDPSERPPANQPCPAMLDLLGGWFDLERASDPIAAVGPVIDIGDALVRIGPDDIGAGIARFDPSQSPPAPVDIFDGVERPFGGIYISGSLQPSARMVISPDGRALALEAGDGWCGDPLVVPAVGSGAVTTDLRRPFPGRAFELIRDLAWAPDGSALYGIRRPTLDALGQPYTANTALGTVVRWDTTSGEVTELPSGCESCSALFVSPDGTHIAAEGTGLIRIYDAEAGWQDLAEGDGLLGWADDGSIVTRSGRVTLDGRTVAWGDAVGEALDVGGPVLSPDGSTIAAMPSSADLKRREATLIDVSDESMRVFLSAPIGMDCEAAVLSARQRCLEGFYAEPGPDTLTDRARIVAWAPDGSAVLVLDQDATASLLVVPVDGSGASAKAPVDALDPPSVVWLPAVGP